MQTELTTVRTHEHVQGAYRILEMHSPEIAAKAAAGQFVHLEVPSHDDRILRRPFSIYRAENDAISILYKPVGRGTEAMTRISVGDEVSLIGPLGTGFPSETGGYPVLVAGGYGMAALYLVAKALPVTGTIFMGGASEGDILCVQDFEELGWDVRIATVDGSSGTRGLVTDAIDPWLEEEGFTSGRDDKTPEFFACGPNGMLKAVYDRALTNDWLAWLSMDRNMGCGIGACLICVQKVRKPDSDDWTWARVCKEGPVFESRQLVWDDDE